jgi:hypothetical protein
MCNTVMDVLLLQVISVPSLEGIKQ